MGINKTSKKSVTTNKKILKRKISELQTLKLENKELKKQIKSLQKIKTSHNKPTAKGKPKRATTAEVCPDCSAELQHLIFTRLDGTFKKSSCTKCEYRTSLAKIK